MKKNLKVKIGDAEIEAVVEELSGEKDGKSSIKKDAFISSDASVEEIAKDFFAYKLGQRMNEDETISEISSTYHIPYRKAEDVLYAGDRLKLIDIKKSVVTVRDSNLLDFAAKGSFENIEELRSYFKNPNVSADGKKVLVKLESGEKLEYQYLEGSDTKLIFIRSVRDSEFSDAKLDVLLPEIKERMKQLGIDKIKQYGENLRKEGGYNKFSVRFSNDVLRAVAKPREMSSWYDKYDCNDDHITTLAKKALQQLGVSVSDSAVADKVSNSLKSFSVKVGDKKYAVKAVDHAEALKLVRDALSVAEKTAELEDASRGALEVGNSFWVWKSKAWGNNYAYAGTNFTGNINETPHFSSVAEANEYKKRNKIPGGSWGFVLVKELGDSKGADCGGSIADDATSYDTILANFGFAWLNSQSNGLETWYYREKDDNAFTRAINNIREVRPNLILSSANDGSRKITIMKDSFKDAMPYNYVMRRSGNGAYLARGSSILEGIIYEGSSKLSGNAERFSKFAAEMLVKDLNRKSIELGHKGDWVIQEITAKDLGLSDALSEGTYYAVVNGKNKTLNIGQLNNPKSYTVMAYGLTSLAEAKEEKVSIARKWNMGPDLYIISYTGERFGWRNPSPDEGKNLKIVDDSSEVLDAEKTRYELIYLNNGETDSVFVEADSDSEAFESLKRDAGRGVNLLEFGKHVNGRYVVLKKYY